MQPLIFILLFGLVQGILLVLFFIHKKLHRSAYIFLLLYLGTMLLQITLKVMSKIWLMENCPVFYLFSHWLPLLYGPLIFLFVKHLLLPGTVGYKVSTHFILPLAVMILLVIAEAGALPRPAAMVLFNPGFRLFVLTVSATAYHMAAFYILKKYKKSIAEYFTTNIMLQLRWIKQFIVVSVISSLTVIAALFLLYMVYPRGHEYRYAFIILSVCIYWFSYTALTRPVVFSVIKGHATDETEKDITIPSLKIFRPNKKYANSTLSEEDALQLCASLQQLMREKKLYLHAELTIAQLSEQLRCSKHHLSQVVNDKLQQSYNDYINHLRVEEAKILLTDDEHANDKIASIAYDAGFNSLSTFNEVFKKLTGKTPSEFRKEMLKQSQQQRV